jgi:hypothetical protein
VIYIIKKINNYNKKNTEINKILNIKKNYSINFNKNKKNQIIFSDNNKKILVCNYIFFGIYQPDTQLWIWSSSIPGVNQKQVKLINKIKNFSYLFENDDDKDIMFIYQLLTNNVIQINDVKLFQLINKTLNYLSDCYMIINPTNKINNMQFIGINSIIENYT